MPPGRVEAPVFNPEQFRDLEPRGPEVGAEEQKEKVLGVVGEGAVVEKTRTVLAENVENTTPGMAVEVPTVAPEVDKLPDEWARAAEHIEKTSPSYYELEERFAALRDKYQQTRNPANYDAIREKAA